MGRIIIVTEKQARLLHDAFHHREDCKSIMKQLSIPKRRKNGKNTR